MLIYDFIERRFDQLNDDDWRQGEYMVDELWDANFKKFKQGDAMVNDICRELYDELESISEDIPF